MTHALMDAGRSSIALMPRTSALPKNQRQNLPCVLVNSHASTQLRAVYCFACVADLTRPRMLCCALLRTSACIAVLTRPEDMLCAALPQKQF